MIKGVHPCGNDTHNREKELTYLYLLSKHTAPTNPSNYIVHIENKLVLLVNIQISITVKELPVFEKKDSTNVCII